MGRIDDAFNSLKQQGRKGFIPFITAGDPDLATTEQILIELANAGATLIELGVPFSDPMADGPVIQRASERALQTRWTFSPSTASESWRTIVVAMADPANRGPETTWTDMPTIWLR